jgi:FeS assembly SUF system protein
MTAEDILRIEKDIVLTLKNIYDPEIPVNIYDLGLIYEIDFDPEGVANIRMTLTAPNCPMADILIDDINTQVKKVDGVKGVNIILTFEPPWDRSMMSEEALLELNLL